MWVRATIESKTITLVFVASTLRIKEQDQTVWFGIRVKWPSGATRLYKLVSLVQSEFHH